MKLEKLVNHLYQKYHSELAGDVSDSIPALSHLDPDLFGISVVTVDGDFFHIGDHQKEFTIQSISKPFSYALALEKNGLPFVEEKVGMEPTGEDYDSVIKLDSENRPYNPMVNSGAIVTTSLINAPTLKERESDLLDFYSKFADKKLSINEAVYQSEVDHGHKNWAISHLLRHFNILSKKFKEDLDLYFKQCSINVTADDLALMGATLANKGVNPRSQKRCISEENLRNVSSIMFTCGMYNYSGEWAFDVGLPAKSGVSGSILMVVPGIMALTVYSPRLDKIGNSVRGIKVCEEISNLLSLHLLDSTAPKSVKEIL